MATFTKLLLSGAPTGGRPIKVTGTATGSAVTLHTAHATALDETWLYAVNTSGSDVLLTIELGGTSADDLIIVTIPAQSGLVQLVPGIPLTGSVLAKAFAATANVVNIVGWVNRIA